MQSKISLKLSLFSISIAGIVFSSIIIFFGTTDLLGQDFYAEPTLATIRETPQKSIDVKPVESVQSIASSQKANPGLSMRLRIPEINVDALVESVGLTSEGAMDTPKGPTNAGWFNQGPRPGEKGNSVIDGHSGWKNDIPAVFDDLNKLRQGDKIYIEKDMGVTVTFVVRELQTFGWNEAVPEVFSSSDEKAHLNLITCGGVWSALEKNYSNRLVVFADME